MAYKIKVADKLFDNLFLITAYNSAVPKDTIEEEAFLLGVNHDCEGNNFSIIAMGNISLNMNVDHCRALMKVLARAVMAYEAGEILGRVEE